MKTLLLTGASGFLGSRIAAFYSKKYNIYAPTHNEMDITSVESVEAAFAKYKPDIVVHCAAISDVGLCEREPEKSWKINVDGSIHIAKASNELGAKCIICSSDQVYFGSSVKEAHREDEELTPANLYGQDKLVAEKKCLEANPDCVLLRLSWMYDTKTLVEGEHSDFFRTLLPKIKNREVLSYPVYDKRGITDVNEVVRNLEKTFSIPGGVYNFGAPNHKNTYDTVYEMFQRAGLGTELLQKNEKAFKDVPRNISMAQDKIHSYGIHFTQTVDSLVENVSVALGNRTKEKE